MDKLKISENGRYFIKADQTPFSWLADTAWTMPQRMKWDDVEYFMQKRKSQGFTVLQIVALDPERDEQMRNPAGERALLDGRLDTPNERYFSYLDRIIDRAEEYGFYVLLLPVWGQLVVGDNWGGEQFEKTVTEVNAYQYGAWIGKRYQDKNHILWCLGGDRHPVHKGVNYKNVWRRMAEGLAKGVTGKSVRYDQPDPAWKELMITYHGCYEMETGECSTMSYWDDTEAWIHFVMIQSGHGKDSRNYDIIAREYHREPVRPVWDGEPAYERMPTTWPVATEFHDAWMVRRRAYWSMFAGSFGHTYGHASVWCTISERERGGLAKLTWCEALNEEGAGQMRWLRALMDDLHVMKGVPAQEILVDAEGQEDLKQHVQACVDAEGDWLCVYLPSGGSKLLNLKKLPVPLKDQGGMLFAWWFNPRDGIFYGEEGKQETSEKLQLQEEAVSISAPTKGDGEDWILILTVEKDAAPVKDKVYFKLEQEAAKKVFEW